MRYETGNPVEPDGSSDPRDLYDNAGIIDVWATDRNKLSAPDRLGVSRKTWHGLEQQVTDYLIAQGYESVYLTYGASVVVERQTQLVQRDGELYRVMNAADVPLTLTGDWAIDAPKLQAVGDAALRQALAGSSGAGLVGYSGQAFPAGTVGAALSEALLEQATPRPILTGGTGASTLQGALSNLGVVNIRSEVTIRGTTTLPNISPASYLIADATVPANFNIFLPAAAAPGALVYLRVDSSAKKLYTVYDGGTLIDGVDRRNMWAGESVLLYKTASGWTKVGGLSVPFRGALRRSATQGTTANTWNAVQFTEAVQDSKGLNLCYNATSRCFEAPRRSTYKFTASVCMTGVTTGSEGYASFGLGNNAPGSSNPINAFSTKLQQAGLSVLSHNLATIFDINYGTLVGLQVRGTAGTPVVAYSQGLQEVVLTYEECLTW